MEKGKVDLELIKRYVRGELSPREMYALERRAQNDPMLMDVILGMEVEANGVHETNLATIRKRIAARTGRGRTRRLVPAQRWAIAATVLIAFSLGTLWFTQWRTSELSQPNLASAPAEAETPRSERPATSTPTDEVAPEGTAVVQSPQAKAPAVKNPPRQRQKHLAAAPKAPLRESAEDTAEAIGLTGRLAAKKQRRLMDTLDETVVVGYGAQKKANLTGAVAKVEPSRAAVLAGVPADVRIDSPVKDSEQALAGSTPGVRIRGVGQQTNSTAISGKIVDGQTQKPLPGVALQLSDGHTVVSDSSGRFVVADPELIQSASFVGYELQSVKVVEKDTVLLIMEPSEVSLDEVVVIGYGQDNKTGKPEPKDGWRAYRRYLKDERKKAEGQKGTVHVTFAVGKDGRPIDIKVIKTTNVNLNSLAIAIVLNGAGWKPGNNGERAVELQLAF